MDAKRLSLKSKVSIRKDLFGVVHSDTEEDINLSNRTKNEKSPLKKIWGESNVNQATSNSLLLSPALKRSPKKFSGSPNVPKSPQTPKKKGSTPRKLSKYSPFRSKVHNPNPQDSIKRFFQVAEKSPVQNQDLKTQPTLLEDNPSIESLPSISGTISPLKRNETRESSSVGEVYCELKEMLNIRLNSNDGSNTQYTPKKSAPQTPTRSNGSTPQSASKALSPTSKIFKSKDVYGSFILRIIFDVMMNETDSDSIHLFTDEEINRIKVFNKFDQPSQRLYGRLLNRKLDWIRTDSMKYGDVTLQLMLLEQNGFITEDYSNEPLEVLLNLLLMPELKKLCKSYKLAENGVKSDLITKLISRAKQPSIKSYFSKATSATSGETNLRQKIQEQMGRAIKVCSEPQKTFQRCLLYFSYPHYSGLERDRFSDQLALVSKFTELTFPTYDIIRTPVFNSREHFVTYESALKKSSELLEAKEDKNWDSALEKSREIVIKLKDFLTNENAMYEAEAMPDFLRRFTAGGCLVRGASAAVEVFKKWDYTLCEAEDCLELLLGQRLFSRHRRGQWFEQLALLYQHNFKDNVKAAQAVLRGLRDEYIDLVARHTLCARAAMLEGRKTNSLKDVLKDTLSAQRGLTEALQEPPTVTITQQVLESGQKGLKQVYIQEVDGAKMLSSVEEVAREHFRQEGFTRGAHDEGSIIKSLVFACFWNEIYGQSVVDNHGVFHSEYQTVPLDWNSETFYDRRREKLKSKLQDLAEGGIEAVVSTFTECHVYNGNKEGIVNWKYLEDLDSTESLIRCIDIDVFLNLSRLLLRYHRVFRSGFPDLTLWDPQQRKCLFVEVKSPNDTLSMKQRVWLSSLNKMGANALVCHVQSVGCKGKKRKADD